MLILKKHITFLVLLFLGMVLVAQDNSIKIEGRVYSEDGDVASTHILNISIQRFTIANANGFFSIPVRVNDTLVFSAVQFKRKQLVINKENIRQKILVVPLEEALTELDEVVVTPYNLKGELDRDVKRLKIEPIVTSSTLGLPNAYVKVKTQNERILAEADSGRFVELGHYSLDSTFNPTVVINLHKILNRISGRTKQLKKFVATDKEIALLNKVKGFYPSYVYEHELKIPKDRLNDFMYFCEVDSLFTTIVATDNQFIIWEFMQKKSYAYRENNGLD